MCSVRMSTSRSTRFHSDCHGMSIDFSDDYTAAERIGRWYHGIVFSEQPVALGKVFQVKILKYDGAWAGSIVSG